MFDRLRLSLIRLWFGADENEERGTLGEAEVVLHVLMERGE